MGSGAQDERHERFMREARKEYDDAQHAVAAKESEVAAAQAVLDSLNSELSELQGKLESARNQWEQMRDMDRLRD